MKYKSVIIFLIILVIAIVLRVYQLDHVPPSLFGDEVDVGYQAYSLLKTGQDLYGQSWPTLVHSLAEYRAPLFIYSAIPFVGFFGLNEWGVRLPAVFFGVLGVIGVFLLGRKLFDWRVGLFASFFLAISPWHLQYSRAGFEVTMLLTFLIFGTYFFLLGIEKKWFLLLSALLFGLTPYIYSTAVLFMPLFLISFVVLFRGNLRKLGEFWIFGALAMMIILAPYAIETVSGNAGNRFNIISIFGNQDIKEKVFLAKQDEKSLVEARIFHSVKITELQNFSINYLRAFSPEFLFIMGDPNPRHSVGDMGQLFFFEIVLLVLGLLGLLKGIGNDANRKLVLAWLLLAPIPAALTYDGGFHATRNFILLVPLAILAALGANHILLSRWKYTKYLGVIVIVLAVLNISFYLHHYYRDYPENSWRAWHYGFKEAFLSEKNIDPQFSKILINNTYEPSLIRFLFWNQYDPSIFRQQFSIDQPTEHILPGFDGFNVGKYYFGKFTGPFEERLDPATLWIASARDDITNPATLNDERVKLLETIYSPSKEPIFYLITGTGKVANEK